MQPGQLDISCFLFFVFFSLLEQMLKDGRNDRAWQNLCMLNATTAKVASVYRQ